MTIKETVEFFISKCYQNNEVRTVRPYFNEKYISNDGKLHKFTEEILSEMIKSNKVKIIIQNEKYVLLSGV